MKQLPLFDIAVVGGGIAGLTAALFAGRAGLSVIVFERAPEPGGRASTQCEEGFYFNQGPHALYRAGEGAHVLQELGISYSGAPASPDGSWVLKGEEKHPIPRTPAALEASRLFSEETRREAVELFTGLSQIQSAEWDNTTLREWLDTRIAHEEVRALFEGLLRLSTYCDDSAVQSAGAALAQMIMGQSGVDYLDGGWQSLVESLRSAAEAAGVRIETHSAVERVHCHGSTATIRLANGGTHSVRAVIATLGPSMLARLVNEGSVASLCRWTGEAVPIYATCLDIALRRLPCTGNQFAIGLDRPLYYSVHTRSAKLAPEGGAVIHLARYLQAGAQNNAREDARELEALLDLLQPGWRDELVVKRFLPRMLVSNAVVAASQGGAGGRPGPTVPEIANLFVAGDWVGPCGMLADASLSSAREAAKKAATWLGGLESSNTLESEFATAR